MVKVGVVFWGGVNLRQSVLRWNVMRMGLWGIEWVTGGAVWDGWGRDEGVGSVKAGIG